MGLSSFVLRNSYIRATVRGNSMKKLVFWIACFLGVVPVFALAANPNVTVLDAKVQYDNGTPYLYIQWRLDSKGGLVQPPSAGRQGIAIAPSLNGNFTQGSQLFGATPNFQKVLHRDLDGNTNYPGITWFNDSSNCNQAITSQGDYIVGQTYTTRINRIFDASTGVYRGADEIDAYTDKLRISIFDGYDPINGLSCGPTSVATPAVSDTQDYSIQGWKNPVIIIPGILGTELYDAGGTLAWADLNRLLGPSDNFLTDALLLNSAGQTLSNVQVGEVIKRLSLVKTVDIFSGLISRLQASGYSTTTLFTFPYDWRLNLDSPLQSLHQRIFDIVSQTGAKKVDIVAHSMGGLLLKNYLNQYGATEYVNTIIFVGTPHLGAPKAGKVLLEGDRFGIPILNPLRMREISLGSPSAYQLLPQSKYFSVAKSYLYLLNSPTGLTFTETEAFLLSRGASQNIFGQARSFFSKNLQDINIGASIKAYNIAGCHIGTQAGYEFDANNTIVRLGMTSGDGTVPLLSADYFPVASSSKFYVRDVDHPELPSASGVTTLISNLLTGSTTPLASNISNSYSSCNLAGNHLVWHSPVEIHVYDSQGRHTGPIEDDTIEFGVPGIDYDVIGHNKFVFLPNDSGETYRVVTKAIGSGTFDFSITGNNNGSLSQSIVFNDVPIATSSVATISISDTSPNSSLQFDALGNGVTTTLNADAVLSGDDVGDLVPPVTTLVGAQNSGAYQGAQTISLSATDDNSGILYTKYILNSTGTQKIYTSPLLVSQEGTTTIQYYSVDRAGNNEKIKTISFVVDATPPEIGVAFDTTSNSFHFFAVDNVDSEPDFVCDISDCTATDDVGNITKIVFKAKDKKNPHKVEFISISYNGSTATALPENVFSVTFKEKEDELKDFDQVVTIKKQEKARVDYQKKKDQSVVTIKEWKKPKEKEKMSGIKYLELLTNNSALEVNLR